MKILFLDMDGVVNSARFFEVLSKRQYRKARGKAKAAARQMRDRFVDMIDPAVVPLLNAIVERAACKVVISSSWRVPWTWREIAAMLRECGFVGEVIGATPTNISAPEPHNENQRGFEIQAWLDNWEKHGDEDVEALAILDDSADMAHLLDRLVQTSWANGLEAEHAERVVALLGGQ